MCCNSTTYDACSVRSDHGSMHKWNSYARTCASTYGHDYDHHDDTRNLNFDSDHSIMMRVGT